MGSPFAERTTFEKAPVGARNFNPQEAAKTDADQPNETRTTAGQKTRGG